MYSSCFSFFKKEPAQTYTLAQYEYAPNNGNLIKTTYGNGNTVELVYDIFDRVVEEKYNGTRLSYS